MCKYCATPLPVNSPNIPKSSILVLSSDRKLRPSGVKPLASGCTPNKWYSQNLNVALSNAGNRLKRVMQMDCQREQMSPDM